MMRKNRMKTKTWMSIYKTDITQDLTVKKIYRSEPDHTIKHAQ